MAQRDIIDRVINREKRLIDTMINKKGIECFIEIPKVISDSNLNDIDVFNDDLSIDIIGEKQDISHSIEFERDSDYYKCLFLNRDAYINQISDSEIENLENLNINLENEVLCNYGTILPIGTRIILADFENIRYEISKIMKYTNLSKVKKYKVVRS
jgi:hypothetical protein